MFDFPVVTPQKPITMDSSVDMSPEEYKATGDHHLEGADSESQEHDFIQDLVSKNRIVIFSKSQCPHCDDSKMLLKNIGVNYMAVELDKMKEGNQVQNVLGHITDARTVSDLNVEIHFYLVSKFSFVLFLFVLVLFQDLSVDVT